MNFNESIDYLFGLGYERSVKKFGLENTYALLAAIGNPEKRLLKIQIAGTNGKGSTCAFLEAICVEARIPVGVNTSPHLVSVTERIRVNGEEITDEEFGEYTTRIRDVAEGLVASGKLAAMPTFFEHITAIAQLFFVEKGVEVAILETGLGGRFDATTATNAEIVGFTLIDLDHTKTLGETIEKIAAEKAAIIRTETRVISAPQKYEAKNIILQKCREFSVDPVWAVEPKISPRSETGGHSIASHGTYEGGMGSYDLDLTLPGRHQYANAVVAIHLAEALMDSGFSIFRDNVERGLKNATHRGRLEFWKQEGGARILFDGAHNVSGAKALREYLIESIGAPITMVFGAMRGKNLGEISRLLFPLADHVILTTPANPRSMPAAEIAESLRGFGENKTVVCDEIPDAIEQANRIGASDGVILVTGSLYLIGEIQAYLTDRKVERRSK